MTQQLSLAAQDILGALCVDELNGSQQLVARAHAAAALRAAALCCKRDTLILLSLADELETQ
jgi:hypothetical protein